MKGIQDFIPCGQKKAHKVYEEIEQIIKAEGKELSPFGIRTSRLIKYLDMSESSILKYAKAEDDADANKFKQSLLGFPYIEKKTPQPASK